MTKEQRQVCANAFEFAREADEPVLVALLEDTELLEYKTAVDWVGYPQHADYYAVMLILPSGHIHFYSNQYRP